MNNEMQSRTRMGGATRVMAIIGFVALIIVGMWGSVQVARVIPGTLSAIASAIVSVTSIFVPADEVITVSAPSLSVQSGSQVTFTLEHNRTVEGAYTFRYTCVEGVTFLGTAGASDTAFCNAPYRFSPINNTFTVTPVSEQSRFVDVEVFVDFTPSGSATATVTGSTLVTIENKSITSTTGTPTTPVPTTPKPTTPRPTTPGTSTTNTYPITGPGTISNPNGYVDLSVRVIEVGIIDKTTGAFTASSTPQRIPVNARPAVRFAVENLGTKVSPMFTFNAVLPTYPAHIFSSQAQQALMPGDRIEFTIGFDSVVDATQGDIVLNIDPAGSINEPNKTNNIVRYTVYFTK
ncbi:MAG: hypothetical protein AAB955_01880 [Patescibacteria group bacterium]